MNDGSRAHPGPLSLPLSPAAASCRCFLPLIAAAVGCRCPCRCIGYGIEHGTLYSESGSESSRTFPDKPAL